MRVSNRPLTPAHDYSEIKLPKNYPDFDENRLFSHMKCKQVERQIL